MENKEDEFLATHIKSDTYEVRFIRATPCRIEVEGTCPSFHEFVDHMRMSLLPIPAIETIYIGISYAFSQKKSGRRRGNKNV